MKKILFINETFNNGSTGKILFDLHNWFLDRNYLSMALYGRGKKSNLPNVLRISSVFGVYFHAFFTRIFGFVGIGSYFSTLKTIKIIKKYKPDVINLHNLHGYYINAYTLLNFLKKARIPTFITCHDYFFISGKCGYPIGCEKWKTLCSHCPQKNYYPKSIFFDRTKYEFNIKKYIYKDFLNLTFIPVSNWLSNSFSHSPLTKGVTIKHIHNGIDTKIFNNDLNKNIVKKSFGFSNKKIILHVTSDFFGRLKGSRYFLDVAERMLDHDNLIFLLIGLTKDFPNLPKNIINLGKIYDQKILAKYYLISDITILTSLEETFSLITAESLCCGTPVLGFKAGGPSEVAPVGYGEFYKYGDVNSLTQSILAFFEGRSNFRNRSEISEFGLQMYSIEKMGTNYENLFFLNK